MHGALWLLTKQSPGRHCVIMIGTLGLYYKIYTLSPRLDLFISNLTTPDLANINFYISTHRAKNSAVGDLGGEEWYKMYWSLSCR